MCGPFKTMAGIFRLLEIILSVLALVIPMFRGAMVNPYGVWCEFVWVFCVVVPAALTVLEALAVPVLLAAFLPDWADLTCGLTVLCAGMASAATVVFGVVFVCPSCIGNILCVIFSLAASVVFLVHGVLQKLKCPSGYLSNLRGSLRWSEALLACILLAGATNYFLGVEKEFQPWGMRWCVLVFAVCLIVTVAIIVLHLLKLLQFLVCHKMGLLELVFNMVAVLSYLSAVIIWPIYGYRHFRTYNPPNCEYCTHKDLDVVMVAASVNLVLYVIDLVLTIIARCKS
ncbi:myeloid-associated differentiation marker-like protein 2 [Aplochiton taeniatus]